MEFQRTSTSQAVEIAQTFRALAICGPRQVGKTWLMEKVAAQIGGYSFVSLDDAALCEQARNDPRLFLQIHPAPLCIDEIQKAPELFPEMKMILDRSSARGQFLMSGSQQFKLMKGAKESLAGRIGILRLQGLSKAEIARRPAARPFVPSMEARQWREGEAWDVRRAYAELLKGCYPECFAEPRMDVSRYFSSYVETYVERDIREMVDISNIGKFRMFMKVCAARTGQLLNYADLARDTGISVPTARTWLSLLETSGLVYILYPYYNNLIKRAVKTPKLYWTDAGLCAHLLGISSAESAIASPISGALLETFVVMEVLKSHWYAGTNASFWFYRDAEQCEVDLILDLDGKLYPIEVKRAASVKARDVVRGMTAFRETAGDAASMGAVLLLSDSFAALDAQTALVPIGRM